MSTPAGGSTPPTPDPNVSPTPGGPVTSGYKHDVPMTGTPLPPSDPWYKMMMIMFPDADPNTIGVYAHKFRDNCMKMFSDAINKLSQQSHETAEKIKKEIEGE